GAWPAGRVVRDTLRMLFERLGPALAAAGPLDGLLIDLHGAMVAEGVDDVEAEMLRLVRRQVGDLPIAVVLDLHGNPSPGLTGLVNTAVAYDTYPHVDMRERGREAAALMAEMLEGRRLRTFLRKVPLLSTPLRQATDTAPMRELQALARRLATRQGIGRISLLPGFPYSDVERAGFTVLLTAEDGTEREARAVGAEIVAAIEARRPEFEVRRPAAAEAVEQAMSARRRPVVLVDVADNVGGGAPGDGTALLRELLARGATGAVITIADAETARQAARAGPGVVIEADVGGKTDDRHGRPVAISGHVVQVTDGRYRAGGTWMTGREFE